MKDRFAEFGQCMAEGLTIRAAAKRMGIATTTALRWRHRFLSEAVNHQARGLYGSVKPDDKSRYRRPRRHACRQRASSTAPRRKRSG